MELVKRYRISKRKLGYMRKKAVLAKLTPVEGDGGKG